MGVEMAAQSNAAPVIIKRKKFVIGGGHHGGAWKVAYADFVTAMMAFFLLMWLLNATTEKQRKGIADYFNPTIPINRISGGGDGAFGGSSVMAEEVLAQVGTGASSMKPSADSQARGGSGGETAGDDAQEEKLAQVEKSLLARSGESMTMKRLLRHVATKVTDEGLVIELFDIENAPLFEAGGTIPTKDLAALAEVISDTLGAAQNGIAIAGHLRAKPLVLKNNPIWDRSSERANAMRRLMIEKGMDDSRFRRISGHGDRQPATADPAALRNNRLEVILLREDR